MLYILSKVIVGEEVAIMPIWFIISFALIMMLFFLVFVLWSDWKVKCHKTIKENHLTSQISGYAITGDDSDSTNLHILSGLLGINTELLVFIHRFRDESMKIEMKIADIKTIDITPYQEKSYYKLIGECCGVYEEASKYYIFNMAGLSIDNKIPKLVRKRLLCKIRSINNNGTVGGVVLFCFQGTAKNLAAVEKIKSKIFCTKNC